MQIWDPQLSPSARRPKRAALVFPLRARIRGVTTWQVLDERGVPEIPRTPSGIAIAGAEGVTGPNLLLNAGLDRFAATSYKPTSNNQNSIRRFLAVGTGSGVPDVTDTQLDNEVQRASDNGGFGFGERAWVYVSADTLWRYTGTAHRVVEMTADRNLTEYGLSSFSGANATLSIRELLRDTGGTPITVSLVTGKKLYLQHTLIIEVPAPEAGNAGQIEIKIYDAANQLVDTLEYDVTYGPIAGPPPIGITNSVEAMFDTWDPSGSERSNNGGMRAIVSPVSWNRAPTWTTQIEPNSSSSGVGNISNEAYLTGSYEREFRIGTTAANLNAVWYGFMVSHSNTSPSSRRGFAVLFDNPTTFEKLDTDTIEVGYISTWNRA